MASMACMVTIPNSAMTLSETSVMAACTLCKFSWQLYRLRAICHEAIDPSNWLLLP